MSNTFGYHCAYEGLGGHRRSELVKTLGEIARAHGLAPPRETWSYGRSLDSFPAGSTVIVAQLADLGTISELPTIVRSMLGRNVRVIVGGIGDLAAHITMLDQVANAIGQLESELRAARAELAEERKERKLVGAHVAAGLVSRMGLTLRDFQSDSAIQFGEQVYERAKQRIADAQSKE